ncbi:ABC transporter ATP-binding protein [Enterococcus columbae]|uniref:ABC transporter domain-containing protein n=1 Tax=Enterococcus columbae DSM 7374 = ATCC 51263 TaxID=1121865 RepID=S0KWQ2_9ENTE|nr:ABC transporter ATP-binding protein [Enterococcus columbae]EOT44543.1 hypothetical protein OMW_00599 [Enterococcus columbae DSM 7374 = ATCC 51263]EOW84701.1 hypothetical protein I568_01197 [Enterococcus columbae DSM 7374 = ATCC 51263]OJG25215.1 hypothetical protein RR47_GL002003 [Enterococcus columbae DSM 7374 = ATCC 51263]
MNKPILKLDKISKRYKKIEILKDVSFAMHAGDIVGLIGLNGAGKSTCMKIILNLLYPSSGEFYVNDKIITCKQRDYLKDIGMMIENPALYEYLTGYQNLEILSSMYPIEVTKEKLLNMLEKVGLKDAVNKQVKNYSLGMKQRLALAQALIHEPKILLLDEPLNGLDPQAIHEFRQIIQQLAKKGVTILLSSHTLSEVEKLATHIVILHQGQVKFNDTMNQFMLLGKRSIHLRTADEKATSRLLSRLQLSFKQNGDSFIIYGDEQVEQRITESLYQQNIRISAIHSQVDELEEIFLKMVQGGK